ncbi:MAG: hemin uptake protein HemP [Ottowia sp.]
MSAPPQAPRCAPRHATPPARPRRAGRGQPPLPGRRDATPAPLPSEQLLQGRKTIEISHNGTLYRLQATKLGKLILTK